MEILVLIGIFFVAYVAIIKEHTWELNKSIPVLIAMGLMWAIVLVAHIPVVGGGDAHHALLHHLTEVAQIILFLIGAMTIVNVMEERQSLFLIGTALVKVKNQSVLIWVITGIAFCMSALLDNLTTTIVILSLIKLIMTERRDQMFFATLVVVAANAGGVWSPIGDVTTTMLWISGKVETLTLIKTTLIPSVIMASVMPLTVTLFPRLRGWFTGGVVEIIDDQEKLGDVSPKDLPGKVTFLVIGATALIMVPILKMVVHMPPFMGMLTMAGLVLLINELMNKKVQVHKIHHELILQKVEWSAILFFTGILMMVAVFQTVAIHNISFLQHYAGMMQNSMSNFWLLPIVGIVSAIIDNVPLVAAAQDMFQYADNAFFWHALAYTSGTGGSLLIIGSAAGVVAMERMKIPFMWYFIRITPIVFVGYVLGYLALYIFR